MFNEIKCHGIGDAAATCSIKEETQKATLVKLAGNGTATICL